MNPVAAFQGEAAFPGEARQVHLALPDPQDRSDRLDHLDPGHHRPLADSSMRASSSHGLDHQDLVRPAW